MPTVAELQEKMEGQAATIELLTRQLSSLMAMVGVHPAPVEPTERADYIEHGSEGHATLIGLVKAEEGEPHSYEGWKLVDRTLFGPKVLPEYLDEVLRQKVTALNAPMPSIQSEDPRRPNYAPPMWRPTPVQVY